MRIKTPLIISKFLKDFDSDTLIISNENNSIDLGKKFMLNSSIPIDKFDSKKISIINQDSVIQTFKNKIVNGVDLILDFEILPNDKYLIEILQKELQIFLVIQQIL